MKRISEESIQVEATTWFHNTYCLKHHSPRMSVFSVPNEIAMMIRGALLGTRLPKSKVDQIIAVLSQKMKNMGLKPGVSDTIFVLPKKTIFIEFKTETGVQSDKQKEFEQSVMSCGQSYYIARSLEDVQDIVKSELE